MTRDDETLRLYELGYKVVRGDLDNPETYRRVQAAQAALVATTRNMALAWIGDGIRVNAVAPGLILTRMTEAMTDPSLAELTERELARIPAGRMGTPEEVAAMVLFLATGSSSYTTAATFAVDGGYLAF